MNEAFAIQGFSQSSMMCVIEGENIFQTDYLGGKKQIGKTTAAYNELEDTCAEYYEKLVDLGVIVKPKTQEQMIADLTEMVMKLTAEVKELKGDEFAGNNCADL